MVLLIWENVGKLSVFAVFCKNQVFIVPFDWFQVKQNLISAEAVWVVARKCSAEKVFLKVLQNS